MLSASLIFSGLQLDISWVYFSKRWFHKLKSRVWLAQVRCAELKAALIEQICDLPTVTLQVGSKAWLLFLCLYHQYSLMTRKVPSRNSRLFSQVLGQWNENSCEPLCFRQNIIIDMILILWIPRKRGCNQTTCLKKWDSKSKSNRRYSPLRLLCFCIQTHLVHVHGISSSVQDLSYVTSSTFMSVSLLNPTKLLRKSD